MRYLFTEDQIRVIIKEAKEHTDDEIVDSNEIDLQHEFNKLNTLLFGGELYPIHMEWNRTRSAHGQVKAQRLRSTGEITIKSLSISKFLDITYKHFKDVLAHEMIHVYWLQKHINAGHDYRFIREMNRINNMGLGFNVTVKADSSQFGLSKEVLAKKKELVFVLMKVDNESETRVAVTTYNAFKKTGYRVGVIYKNLTKSGKYKNVTGKFYIGDNPELQRHPIQRTFNSISYENIKDDVATSYTEGARELSSFTASSGELEWKGSDIPTKPQESFGWR